VETSSSTPAAASPETRACVSQSSVLVPELQSSPALWVRNVHPSVVRTRNREMSEGAQNPLAEDGAELRQGLGEVPVEQVV